MSENSLLQSYNYEANNFEETFADYVGDTQFDASEVQFSHSIPDEVISVYEVYVKEESEDSNRKCEMSLIPGLPSVNDHQLVQVTNCCDNYIPQNNLDASQMILKPDSMDMDTAINPEAIKLDGAVSDFLGKDTLKYKVLEPCIGTTNDNNVVVYSHSMPAVPSTSTRLIDKDDPRSRLHFVKYLKRDGKTMKIWECGICSKEFRHQYTLMRHLPTHTDERNFKCEACGKAFRQLSTLSQHKAIHSDARPYVCEFCKKTFNRVSTLISHRKTHSEHKPHKCHLCGKGFHQKGNLRNHVFTHTNERPYKCEVCGKGFNQMSNLVCHKVKAHAHTEKMQYTCSVCGKEFPRRFSLRSHEEYKHGIKYRHPVTPQTELDNGDLIKNKNVRIVQLPNEQGNQISDVKDSDILNSMFTTAIDDLKITEKINFNPDVSVDGNEIKTIQLCVPTAGLTTPKIENLERSSFMIEPRGQEDGHSTSLTYFGDIGNEPQHKNNLTSSSSTENYNELLELAAQGGIQFIRATEDGRYEVMTSSEARDLMAQNTHDMAILNGEEADALNIVNGHGNSDIAINGPDSQIMMLNPDSTRKKDDIGPLEDKDIRILENKALEDRFIDNITFLSQSKIDDYILGSKSLDMENGITDNERDDEGIGIISNHQDLTNILGHRTDMSALSTTPNSPPIPIFKNLSSTHVINHPSSYIKNNHTLADDINNPASASTTQDQSEYDMKLKMPVMFENSENDIGLASMTQSEIKNIRLENHNRKVFMQTLDDHSCLPPKLYPDLNEVKILGPKNYNQERITNQLLPDIKILSPYDDFLKNTPFLNVRNNNPIDRNDNSKKEIKILGKKPGLVVTTRAEEDNGINIFEEKRKSIMGGMKNMCNSADSGVSSTSRLDKQTTEHNNQESFLLQAYSPCGTKYMNFENCLINKGNSPDNQSTGAQSTCRNSYGVFSLPDLDP